MKLLIALLCYKNSKFITTIRNTPELKKEHLVKLMLPNELIQKITSKEQKEVDKPVVLAAKNVYYKNKVRGFSFELKEGEVLGIAGLMGAGRTELLKCIFGAYKADSGEFSLNGKTYKPQNPTTAIRNRIALISEDRKKEGLVLSMSIIDNMLFPNLSLFSIGPIIRKGKANEKVGEQAKSLNLNSTSWDLILAVSQEAINKKLFWASGFWQIVISF